MKTMRRLYRRLVRWPYQRLRYGCSEQDSWNLCDYAEQVLARGMECLAANSNSVPFSFADRAGSVDAWAVLWQSELRRIAATLRNLDANWDDVEADVKARSECLAWLVEHWDDLWE